MLPWSCLNPQATPFLQPKSCSRQAVYHHRPDPSTGPVWMISEFNECVVHNWGLQSIKELNSAPCIPEKWNP